MSNISSFDEDSLRTVLRTLPKWSTLAFGAAVATRLLPCYTAFAIESQFGDFETLRDSLEFVWDNILARSVSRNEIAAQIVACERQVPDEDMTGDLEHPYGIESAAAVVYCLEAFEKDCVQSVTWIARCAYTVLDNYVSGRIKPTGGGVEERVILTHPLVLREFARQQRDLDICSHNAGESPASVVSRIRSMAGREQLLV